MKVIGFDTSKIVATDDQGDVFVCYSEHTYWTKIEMPSATYTEGVSTFSSVVTSSQEGSTSGELPKTREFKKGDRVGDYGQTGIIYEINPDDAYPIKVQFSGAWKYKAYTIDGRVVPCGSIALTHLED